MGDNEIAKEDVSGTQCSFLGVLLPLCSGLMDEYTEGQADRVERLLFAFELNMCRWYHIAVDIPQCTERVLSPL